MTAEIVEEELRSIGPDEVLVKTVKSLISPGTELSIFEGKHTSFLTGKSKFPCSNAGYSNVGIIETIGPGVTGYSVGEKIFSLAGHSDRSIAWKGNISKIPEGLDDESATFAAVGAVALHGIRATSFSIGETLLIMGQGLIGQITLRLAVLTGVGEIVVTDTFDNRLELSKEGGASYAINITKSNFEEEIQKVTLGKGCNVVIDTTGNPNAIKSSLSAAAIRGRVIILGCPHGEVSLNLYDEVQRKELSLIGSYQPNCPSVSTHYYPWSQHTNRQIILQYLKAEVLKFSKLITHRGHYTLAQNLFLTLSQEKDKSIAAIMDWNEKQ